MCAYSLASCNLPSNVPDRLSGVRRYATRPDPRYGEQPRNRWRTDLNNTPGTLASRTRLRLFLRMPGPYVTMPLPHQHGNFRYGAAGLRPGRARRRSWTHSEREAV